MENIKLFDFQKGGENEMTDDATQPGIPVWNERAELEKHIAKQVYHALESAGDLCRIHCKAHPDLLDYIAKGIYDFLCDGDVFDQVVETLIVMDPDYFGRRLASLDEEKSKLVIGVVLNANE